MTHTRYYLEHLEIQIPLMPLKLDHLFPMGAQVLHHDSCPNKTLLQASSNLQIALMKLAHKGYPQILKLMYEKKTLTLSFYCIWSFLCLDHIYIYWILEGYGLLVINRKTNLPIQRNFTYHTTPT
jgi:hypothetical protein